MKPKGDALYSEIVYNAWDNGTIITMPFFGCESCQFRILGLDYAYDVAELECISDAYEGEKQSVSFAVLEQLLMGGTLKQAQYRYVNRWFDADGIPHYFGVYSKYPTMEETQRNIRFSSIDVPVDIVYQAVDEADMFEYLADVNTNRDFDDFE